MLQKQKKPGRPLDPILRIVRKSAPARIKDQLTLFFRHYFADVSSDDISDKEAREAYAITHAHWELAQQRAARKALIKVYNPDVAGAFYTVVDIVTDDMPFLVDSVRMELNRQGFIVNQTIHPVYAVIRNEQGVLQSVVLPHAADTQSAFESFIHIEIERTADAERLTALQEGLEEILQDVRRSIQDWKRMQARMQAAIDELDDSALPVAAARRNEAQGFLQWLLNENFILLGCEEYEATQLEGVTVLQSVQGSALGLNRGKKKADIEPLVALSESQKKSLASELLVLTKSIQRSTVHRPGYLDYVAIRRFDKKAKQISGEYRFLGLYTSVAYRHHPRQIPLIGAKVEKVLAKSKFDATSHRGKAFLHILDTYPRDELFQISEADLLAIAKGILHLGDRQRLRIFIRADKLRRFISCLVYVPRDIFDTELRLKISDVIKECFNALDLTFNVKVTDESFARVEYFVRVDPDNFPRYSIDEIEARLQEISYSWKDRFRNVLMERVPEEQHAKYMRTFANAFPAAYCEDFNAAGAFDDALVLEGLSGDADLNVRLYCVDGGSSPQLRLKLYHYATPIAPSDGLPILENMGVRVLEERPYRINLPEPAVPCWIHDYKLQYAAEITDVESLQSIFQEVFAAAWRGEIENDGFNALVLVAGLPGSGIRVLRAYCKYLLQAGLPFSQAYMEQCVRKHPLIVESLLKLFVLRFRLDIKDSDREQQLAEAFAQIEPALDAVSSLDEDRILRNFLALVQATIRTNFFQTKEQSAKSYIAFKFDTAKILELPQPRPMYEIFVYSPRVEGVHLRTGKVARGGLRWSDRREDFRTEVLGLVKAQRVKNAVIVPTGAKGGFIVKRPPPSGGRDALMQEVVACYKQFISALLDVTDNMVGGEIAPPPDLIRYDGDDPYLVVAADKGTATFSDIANEVAHQYGFWLDDAFASGGSQGYDHKKMGITARGAWESVRLHFRDLGKDIQSEPFTVIGVGDMSGDVFGNGMLLSRHIKLIAAFNHMHIFLDPDPDPEKSFRERERLFKLARSGWQDYNSELISQGGGVYPRDLKAIQLSPEMQSLLGTTRKKFTPNELIQSLLKAPVDLLWNGGIGTYVKASNEQHADVGDRSNDMLRINANELNCKVVGEGGNLGLTQRARIEYVFSGGRADADFIHNAGGVNCSDHEVNIKILLNLVMQDKRMTRQQRDQLLTEMTDEVAALVLQSNYWQTQAITLIETEAHILLDEHARYIRYLEIAGQLDRKLEALPDDEQINERKADGLGLARPEIALLISYSKLIGEAELVDSDVLEDSYFSAELPRYFPIPLRKQWESYIRKHPLRKEILSMFIIDRMVNRMGCTFAFRMYDETGAGLAEVVRAYTIAWEVFNLRGIWGEIATLDNKIPAALQNEMMLEAVKLISRASKWLIQRRKRTLNIHEAITAYSKGAQSLGEWLPGMLARSEDNFLRNRLSGYLQGGVNKTLALQVLSMDALYCTFDIVDIGEQMQLTMETVSETYFALSAYLDIFWLRVKMREYKVSNHWQELARRALIDDLYKVLGNLTRQVLKGGNKTDSAGERIAAWHERNQAAVDRSRKIPLDLKTTESLDLAMFSVSLRELQNLHQACEIA